MLWLTCPLWYWSLLSSARVPLPDYKHWSYLFLFSCCKSQGLGRFCSGHLGWLFQCALRKTAVLSNSLYKLIYISTQKPGIQLPCSDGWVIFFLKMFWNRHQVKATCLPLGTGKLFMSWMSKKTCSHAGLLREAFVCVWSWACPFPDARQRCVCGQSSSRKVTVAPSWECVASSEHTCSDFWCSYDILKDVKQKWNIACSGERVLGSRAELCLWSLCRNDIVTPASFSKLRSVLLNKESVDNKHSVIRYERNRCGLRCLYSSILFMDFRNINS